MVLTSSVRSLHIHGLDTIRLLAAVWVAMSHGAIPFRALSDDATIRLALSGFATTFNGVAAVMVFFIVSGLCIQLPHVGATRVDVIPFIVRRFVRVGLPLVGIAAIARVVGQSAVDGLEAVAWSLYAELFYYSIFPALFVLARRFGWGSLLAVSALPSVGLAATFYNQVPVNMGWLAWIWGLPVWISGCLLAEIVSTWAQTAASHQECAHRLTLLSIATWATSAVPMFFQRLGLDISYPVTMLPFSLLAWFWLRCELQHRQPVKLLEQLGAASYSIYLVHNVAICGLKEHLLTLHPLVALPLRITAIAGACYVFFKLVEYPAHRLARGLAQRC